MKKNKTGFGIISSIKFLGGYLKRYRLSFILFAAGWFLEGVLQLMLPILFGILIDEMVYYRNIGTFLQISLVIFIFTLFLCSLYFVIYTFFNHIVGRYAFDIKMDLYDHLLKLKNEYMDDMRAGDVITTIQTYTRECILIITRNLVYTVYCLLMIVLFSTYVMLVSWKIGLLFFLFVPVSVYVTLKNGKITRNYSDRYRAEYGRFIGWLFEMLNGLNELKLLGAHSKIRQMFARRHRPLFRLEIRKNLINLHLSNVVEFLNLCMLVSILGFGGWMTIRGDLTIGALIVVASFFTEIKNNIVYLHGYYVDFQDRVSAVKYIKDFKDAPREEDTGTKPLVVQNGEIEFRDVRFSRTGNVIFDNLSFRIGAGEKVAVVGKSGSGKTTLVNLLIALFRPERGTIFIDGRDMAECTLKSIRNNIGIVQQKNPIFDGTIRENIRLGNLKATEEELMAACRKTGILSFVNGFDSGLDTVVGSKGVQLSGGQKQLIAITRICLKDPPIIILDEATSSLDRQTEQSLFDNIEQIFPGKTLIVISHNLSSVTRCDRVIMIDKGEIVEEGKPEEMRMNSRFQELFSIRSQTG